MRKLIAVIPAAGLGRRFGAVTRNMSKGLLMVGGKPLLLHSIEQLQQAGIRNIFVVTGYQSDKLQRVLGRKIKTIFNPFYRVSGVVGSMWAAKPYIEGKAFLFTACDHFYHPMILKACLKTRSNVHIIVHKKRRYTKEDVKVLIRKNRVIDLGKNIPTTAAHGEFAGMVYLSAKASKLFYEVLTDHLEDQRLDGYVLDVLKDMTNKHRMPIHFSWCYGKSRIEIDSVADLIEARKIVRNFHKLDRQREY